MTNLCSADSCAQPIYCRGVCKKHYNALYHREHRAESNKKVKQWYEENKEKHKHAQKGWHLEYPEYWTVKSHWGMIFGAKPRPTYVNMPFCTEWNPRAGGSYLAGVIWVVENLGHRPDKHHQLHIIQKSVGFVPGNLMWIPVSQHKRNELINLVLEENKKLRDENQMLLSKISEEICV